MKQILLILSLLFSFSAFSQDFSIGIRAGLGDYSMDLLSQFQQYRTSQSQLPLKITESYPITPFYRAEVAFNDIPFIEKMAVFYGYYSTGARSTVSDYSGRVDLDAVINGNQMGLTIQKEFLREGFMSLGGYVDGSYLLTELKTKDFLEITYPEKFTEKEDYSLVASGFALEPGLELNYRLDLLVFQINWGYLIDFSKELHLKDNKEMMLGVNNQPVTPQWSGLRFGLQISYLF